MSNRSYAPRHAGEIQPSTGDSGHRTARRVTAVIGTLGVAAVVSTSIAGAADATTSYAVWDRVANCESNNHWHINTGNGFYGGLQFSAGTWSAKGGHKYARQAHLATRVEQIEVARRVLASQGPGAWPVCGPRAGLTRSSGHATRAALPRVAGTVSHPVAHTTHKKKHHATKHHAKKHHAKSHHKSRTHHGATYKVRSGDTLAKIARKLHVSGGWHALYRANHTHMSNPNVLHIGQVLRLP